jgi:hypothetical protein
MQGADVPTTGVRNGCQKWVPIAHDEPSSPRWMTMGGAPMWRPSATTICGPGPPKSTDADVLSRDRGHWEREIVGCRLLALQDAADLTQSALTERLGGNAAGRRPDRALAIEPHGRVAPSLGRRLRRDRRDPPRPERGPAHRHGCTASPAGSQRAENGEKVMPDTDTLRRPNTPTWRRKVARCGRRGCRGRGPPVRPRPGRRRRGVACVAAGARRRGLTYHLIRQRTKTPAAASRSTNAARPPRPSAGIESLAALESANAAAPATPFAVAATW